VLDWMLQHEGEIAHLDLNAPPLPPLPLLSAAQLRTVGTGLPS
jgi:hypothetical protein